MKSLHKRGLQLARVSELSPLHTPWPEHIQQTTQRCPKCKLGAGEQVVMKEPENLAPNSASCPPRTWLPRLAQASVIDLLKFWRPGPSQDLPCGTPLSWLKVIGSKAGKRD